MVDIWVFIVTQFLHMFKVLLDTVFKTMLWTLLEIMKEMDKNMYYNWKIHLAFKYNKFPLSLKKIYIYWVHNTPQQDSLDRAKIINPIGRKPATDRSLKRAVETHTYKYQTGDNLAPDGSGIYAWIPKIKKTWRGSLGLNFEGFGDGWGKITHTSFIRKLTFMELHTKAAWKEPAWTFSTAPPLASVHCSPLTVFLSLRIPFLSAFNSMTHLYSNVDVLQGYTLGCVLTLHFSDWAHLPMVSITWNPFPAPTKRPTFPTTILCKCAPGNSNLIPESCFFF